MSANPMNPASPTDPKPGGPLGRSFSRCAFLASAGGLATAFVAPLVAGQRVPDAGPDPVADVLAPTVAQAAEPATSGSFDFDVASPAMLALKVVDVSKEGKPGVPGALAYVESLSAKGKSFTRTTNDQGTAVVDLTTLAEKPKGTDPTYKCDVSIMVRADGYRQVNIPTTRLDAGVGVALPTCPVEDRVPYFREVSFDGYDIQYRLSTFAYSSGNDDTHDLAAELYLKGLGEAEVSFWRWRSSSNVFPGFYSKDLTCLGTCDASISADEVRERQAADDADAKAAAEGRDFDQSAHDERWIRSVSLSDRFLQTAFNRSLLEGDRLVVRVQTGVDSTAYLMSAQFKPALISGVGTGNYSVLPGFSNSGIAINLPSHWPYIGGHKLSFWEPSLPFLFRYDPVGYLMLGFAPPLAEVDFDKKEWTKTEYESFKDQWEEANKKVKDRYKNTKEMYKNWKDGDANGDVKRAQCKMFSKFEVGVAAQFFADLDFDWAYYAKGGLNFVLGLSGEASFDFNIMLGPIPLYLSIKPSAELSLNMRAAIETTWPSGDAGFMEKLEQAISETNVAWSDNQIAIVLVIALDVGAGVGAAGLASLGVRGSAALTNYLGLADGSAHGAEDWKWPHYRVGAGLDVSICAQVWLIKYSKKLWGENWPAFYDSWGNYPKAASLEDGLEVGACYETACGLPEEFVLSANAAGVDDGDLPTDENGNVVISLEELEAHGVKVTDAELVGAGEFKATTSAKAASLEGADDRVLVAVPMPAGDEEGAVETYAFKLAEPDGEEVVVAADGGSDGDKGAAVAAVAAASVADADDDDAADADADGADADVSDAGDANATDAPADSDDGTEADASAGDSSADVDTQAGDANEDDCVLDFADTGDEDDFDYSYDDVPSHEPSAGEVGPDASTAGVASIAGDGVIKPSIDRMFLKGVFSDGRVRVVKLGAGGYQVLLRIASGTYNGQARTRLVAQVRYRKYPTDPNLTWSSPKPIDFRVRNLGDITRDQLFDYDFDVCEAGGEVFLILLSGTRPDGERTSLLDTCTNPVTTVLKLGVAEGSNPFFSTTPWVTVRGAVSWRSFDGGASLGEGSDLYLTYAPTISASTVQLSSSDERLVYITCGLLYKRAGADKILSADTPTRAAAFVFRGHMQFSTLEVTHMSSFEFPDVPSDVAGLSCVRNSLDYDSSGREKAVFDLAYESPSRSGYRQVRATYEIGYTGRVLFNIAVMAEVTFPGVKKMYRNGLDAYSFLAVDADGVVCEVDTDTGVLAPVTPYDVQTDENGGDVYVATTAPSFAVTADRQFLVYADNKRGINGYEYDDSEQEAEPEATYEDGRYRIMACRAVTSGGITLYSKPFVLCQVDHAIDDIAAATVTGTKIRIIASAIVNLAESKSNYYEIEAPVVACLTVKSLVSPMDVLFPGEPTPMELTFRNDGNTQVGAAKYRIVEVDESGNVGAEVVPETELSFGPDTIASTPEAKPNPDDPMGAPVFSSGYHNVARGGSARAAGKPFDDAAFQAHPLVADDGLRFLKPGCEATVTQNITIPEGSTGKKKLRVLVSDVKFANPACASASSWADVDESWAGAAAATADCDEGSVVASAIDSSALEAVAEEYADKTTIEAELTETGNGDDSLALLRSSAVSAMTEGGEVDPGGGSGGNGGNGGDGGNGGSGGSGGSGSGSGNGGKKRLPDTGDASLFGGALGVVGAVAAVAGAGFAAYSRRRAEVEAEEAMEADFREE